MAVNSSSLQPEDKDCLQAIISEAVGDNLIGPFVY